MSKFEPAEIEEAFNFFDKDGSGKLEHAELSTALHILGVDVSDAELQDISASDGDAETLTFDEFEQIVNSDTIAQINFKERLIESFLEFAGENERKISKATLLKILTQRGQEPMSEEDATGLLDDFDADADGFIDVEELGKLLYDGLGVQIEKTEEQDISEDA